MDDDHKLLLAHVCYFHNHNIPIVGIQFSQNRLNLSLDCAYHEDRISGFLSIEHSYYRHLLSWYSIEMEQQRGVDSSAAVAIAGGLRTTLGIS